MSYTGAYTGLGVKCISASSLSNNPGAMAAIRVTAPENTIVNASHPCAVVARSNVGHMVPDAVFGCLHQAIQGQVPAEGTAGPRNIKLIAGHGISTKADNKAASFMVMSFHSRGAGAGPTIDGSSATPFPSGERNV